MKSLVLLLAHHYLFVSLNPGLNSGHEYEKIDQPFEKIDISTKATSYEPMKVYMQDYERLMALSSEVNSTWNKEHGLVP